MQDSKTGVSWVMASFLLVNVALGAGIVNYPFIYDRLGGVYFATFSQIVIFVLIFGTLFILIQCANLTNSTNYHEVLFNMCGRRAQHCAALCIAVSCYGICITYLVIVGDQYDRIFYSLLQNEFCTLWYLDRRFTITATAVIFILPLCYFQRVDFLRYVGMFGIFATLYPVFLTTFEYYKLDAKPEGVKVFPDDIVQFFAVIPVLCFTYQSHEGLLPIYSSMRHRDQRTFTKAAFSAMLILFVIYTVPGCFGYLTFGSDIAPDIMVQYDGGDPVVLVGIGALVVKMVAGYPMIAVCGREAIEGLYAEFSKQPNDQLIKNEFKRRIIVTSLFFGTSLSLAVFTPNIGISLELLGCLSSINIFVFPGMCLIALARRKDPGLRSVRSYLKIAMAGTMILFGVVVLTIVFLQVVFMDLKSGGKMLDTYFKCS